MSSGTGREWLPTFGVSWQVVQVPLMAGAPSASLRPATPVIVSGWVLNTACPRATALRASALRPESLRFCHGAKMVKASGSKAVPVGIVAQRVVDAGKERGADQGVRTARRPLGIELRRRSGPPAGP